MNNDFAFENEDYWGVNIVVEGNEIVDYEITPNFAKKLCMMSKSDKGEQARNYFLKCEEILKQKLNQEKSVVVPLSYKEALQHLITQVEKNEQLEKQIEKDKPKVEFAEQLLLSTNALDFATACKTMNLPFGRNKLFARCRELGILRRNNIPYQEFQDKGYFTVLEFTFNNPKTGDNVLTTKTMITAKGQKWLLKQL